MVRIRLLTQAFLSNGGKTLMLKRSSSRKIAPGLWTGVGGHIEDGEQSDPESAVLREIEEETGIAREELSRVKLRYIMMRNVEGEIRQHFVYFAETSRTDFVQCDEGTLTWVDTDRLSSLPMPLTTQKVIEHYFRHSQSNDLFIGIISKGDVQWSILDK